MILEIALELRGPLAERLLELSRELELRPVDVLANLVEAVLLDDSVLQAARDDPLNMALTVSAAQTKCKGRA